MTAQTFRWSELPVDQPMDRIDRRRIIGEKMMISHVTLHEGFRVPTHSHANEQFALVMSGRVRFNVGDAARGDLRTVELTAGEVLHLPPHVPHDAEALETSVVLDLFSPPSEETGVDAAS